MKRLLHPVVFLLAIAGVASAQVPLEGYYRAGRYMPVRVTIGTDPLTISADGAIPTVVGPASSRGEAIIPFLVYRAGATSIKLSSNGKDAMIDASLHPLGPDDRLVGFSTASVDVVRELFPGKTLIPIRLDPAVPLPGAIDAWESLDAVILDKEPPVEQILALLAAGTTVVIRGEYPPNAPMPWNRLKGFWYTFYTPTGWTGTQITESAYQPTFAWVPGRQDELRNMVFLIGILFAIATLAMALLARRATAGAIVAGVLTTMLVLGTWLGRQSPVRQTGAQAIVMHSLTQRDQWTWQTTLSESDATMGWEPLLHPMFFSPAQVNDLGIELVCRGDGTPLEFRYHLGTDHRVAFVSRMIGGDRPTRFLRKNLDSPLLELVRAMYLRPGDEIIGQITGAREQWGDVVIRPANPWATKNP